MHPRVGFEVAFEYGCASALHAAACGLCGFPPEFEAVPEASSESEPGADLEPELDLVAGNAHGAGEWRRGEGDGVVGPFCINLDGDKDSRPSDASEVRLRAL